MTNVVILQDNTITFPLHRANPRGFHHYKMAIDTMFHPQGFFIPGTMGGCEVLDLISGRPIDLESMVDNFLGVLITAHNQVYKYVRVNQSSCRTRVVYGMGASCVMSCDSGLNQAVSMALHLCDGNVSAALDVIARAVNIRREDFVTRYIPDIITALNAKGYDKVPMCVEPLMAGSFNK